MCRIPEKLLLKNSIAFGCVNSLCKVLKADEHVGRVDIAVKIQTDRADTRGKNCIHVLECGIDEAE